LGCCLRRAAVASSGLLRHLLLRRRDRTPPWGAPTTPLTGRLRTIWEW